MDRYEIRIWNMHGPTVYAIDTFDQLPSLIKNLDWLNDSNAGVYRIMITIEDRFFELAPRTFSVS